MLNYPNTINNYSGNHLNYSCTINNDHDTSTFDIIDTFCYDNNRSCYNLNKSCNNVNKSGDDVDYSGDNNHCRSESLSGLWHI